MRITKHKDSNKKLEQVIATDDGESVKFNIWYNVGIDTWFGESLDGDIAVKGDTRDEVFRNLEEEIELYFNKRNR